MIEVNVKSPILISLKNTSFLFLLQEKRSLYNLNNYRQSSSSTTKNPASTSVLVEKLKDSASSTPSSSTSGMGSGTNSGGGGSSQQPPLPYVAHGTPDPYLTHFDPRSEHQSYKQAQMRLEEIHKEEVTKVK